MKSEKIEKVPRGLVLAALVAVPVIFSRAVIDSFDMTKALVLWIVAATGFPLLLLERRIRHTQPFEILLSAFVVGALMSTLLSASPSLSFWGQYQRYAGFLTLLSVSILALLASRHFDIRSLPKALLALCFASLISSAYALLQNFEMDPFEWTSDSFGKLVFGTMRNPNTASGLAAVSLPAFVWLAMDSQRSRAIRSIGSLGFAIVVTSLAMFNSFQGSVASLFAGVVAISLMISKKTFANLLQALAFTFGSLVLPNLPSSMSGWWVIVVCFLYCSLPLAANLAGGGWLRRGVRWRHWMPALGAIALILLVVFRKRVMPLVSDGFAGGFIERGDFYRSGFSVLKANPVFGSGLDTFGLFFTRYRPEGHALRLENSRTSSVHSVHLGMFSNGGVVLGLLFLLLLLFTAIRLIRVIRCSDGRERDLAIVIGSVWMALHLQSLVSVEHVALLCLLFISTGLVWSLEPNNKGKMRERATVNRERRRLQRVVLNHRIAFALAGILGIASAPFLAIPFRANLQYKAALVSAYVENDLAGSIRELKHASALASWESVYHAQLAELLMVSGDVNAAAKAAARALVVSEYYPGFGVGLAQITANSGQLDQAVSQIELVVASDPYARGLRISASNTLREISNIYIQQGRNVEANDALVLAEKIDPTESVSAG